MVSALVILGVDSREGGDDTAPRWRQAAAPALFYAGAIALKPTGVVFLGLQFTIAAAASCWVMRDWRAGLAKASWTATWSLIFIGPWLLLYAPYYLIALTHPIGLASTPVPQVRVSTGIAALFSPAATFYGPSRLAYTCVVGGLFLCAVHAALRARGELASRRPLVELASASAAAGASYLFWVLIGPHLDEPTSMVRYSIPVLIGAAAVALPLWAAVSVRPVTAVSLIAAALLVVLFAASTRERVSRLLHQGTELAYLHSWSAAGIDRARDFMAPMLRGEGAAEVQQFQDMIPPGEPMLAWTVVPFLLDYRRNTVVDVNVLGLGKPWGRVSPFRYVLWQYQGYGANTADTLLHGISVGRQTGALDARALDVLRWLEHIVPASDILDSQDGTIVFQTSATTVPPPN
jgi:hypothetical protein